MPASIRILIARDAIDFREAHDGLLAVIRDEFGNDPFEGSLFVFLNRGRDILCRLRDHFAKAK